MKNDVEGFEEVGDYKGYENEVFDKRCGIVNDLHSALKATRGEPGLSIEKTANIIKSEFDFAETESLIRELKVAHIGGDR